jgi:hypothetical protein
VIAIASASSEPRREIMQAPPFSVAPSVFSGAG